MNIVHFCQFKLDHSNGVQAAVWTLACEQAKAGEQVEIFSLGRIPKPNEVTAAEKNGILLRGGAGGWKSGRELEKIIRGFNLDRDAVIHFHSIFIVNHARLASLFRKHGYRYVISPHGNLAPRELKRKKLKKKLYFWLFLRKKLREAAMVICVSKEEVRVVNDLVPEVNARNLGNGVDPGELMDIERGRSDGKVKALSLAKSDVENKGYDRMFALSQVFEGGVDYYVIRYDQGNHLEIFDSLVIEYTGDSSIRIHEPVYGRDKNGALEEADVFFHLARWEVFGIVLIEAAFAGLPIVISKECDLAKEIEEAKAGLVVDAEAIDARELIGAYLSSQDFAEAGKRARDWAISRYSGEAIARMSLEFYRDVISS